MRLKEKYGRLSELERKILKLIAENAKKGLPQKELKQKLAAASWLRIRGSNCEKDIIIK